MSVSQDDPALRLRALEFWHNVEKERIAQINAQCRDTSNPPLRPPHSVDADVREVIGHEMDAIVQMQYSLRFYYNSLAPVNRLPAEVLTRVFSFLQVLDPPRNLDHAKPAVPHDIGWLRATHVCRQWRIAALGHPRLWSNVRVSLGAKWMNAFLDRAQTVPLEFSTAGLSAASADRHSEVSSVLVSNLGRMHRLRASALNHAEFSTVFWHLGGAAPVLEKASLHTTLTYWDFSIMEAGMQPLPPWLFGGAAPCLRELRISGFSAFWLAIPFTSLVSLSVDGGTDKGVSNSHLQNFDACLGALAGLPRLESLRLRYVLPELPLDVALDTLPIVTLPSVRKFSLSDHVLECAVALQHISTPALKDEAMRVRCKVDTIAGRGADLIYPWVTSRLHAASSTGSGSTSIYCWTNRFRVCVSDHCANSPEVKKIDADADSTDLEPGPFYAPAMGTPFLRLSFDGFAGTAEGTAEIGNIIGLLPPACLESLKLYGERAFHMENRNWFALLAGCSAVRHVTPAGDFARAFIQIQAATRERLFASADSVTLQDLDFTAQELILDLQIAWHNEAPRTVYILCCWISREVREWMARRVPRVFWDGVSDPERPNSENDESSKGGEEDEDEDDEDEVEVEVD
ncbi:hypothetical protein DENSPDRAFT_145823 [Dentipellis sp. KUC8613]|nr:hypothetical protein DENSPDRAFT_145823 [Dentipellis sp. KUC8613]